MLTLLKALGGGEETLLAAAEAEVDVEDIVEPVAGVVDEAVEARWNDSFLPRDGKEASIYKTF